METSDEITASTPARKPWSQLKRDLGVVVWISFLASAVGTMFFFAYFDPMFLARDDVPPAWLEDRMFAYAVGFFFFWIIAAASGALVAYLLDTDHERIGSHSGSERKP